MDGCLVPGARTSLPRSPRRCSRRRSCSWASVSTTGTSGWCSTPIKSFGGSALFKESLHVGVQLSPDNQLIEPEAAQEYLESYFGNDQVNIFWGDTRHFLDEFRSRTNLVTRAPPPDRPRPADVAAASPYVGPRAFRRARPSSPATGSCATRESANRRARGAPPLTVGGGQDVADPGRANPIARSAASATAARVKTPPPAGSPCTTATSTASRWTSSTAPGPRGARRAHVRGVVERGRAAGRQGLPRSHLRPVRGDPLLDPTDWENQAVFFEELGEGLRTAASGR